MTEGTCPVCGQQYYERIEHTLNGKKQVSNFASNNLFGECARITRVAAASEPWEAEVFTHTVEQTYNTRS